jgi:TonB family protein
MTHDEFLAAVKQAGGLRSAEERHATVKRLIDEFHRTAPPEELEVMKARARRSHARLGGAVLAIVLGMGSCMYFLAPDNPPELVTSEGIRVSTCEKIQRRGCESGNVDDCALDCSPTSESMEKLLTWLNRKNEERAGTTTTVSIDPQTIATLPAPVRVGGDVKEPQKIKDVKPVYPQIARTARVQGIVIIEAVIAADGSIKDARILRSVAVLDQAALDAVRQWKFKPTVLNGKPVEVIMPITVNFELPNAVKPRERKRDPHSRPLVTAA